VAAIGSDGFGKAGWVYRPTRFISTGHEPKLEPCRGIQCQMVQLPVPPAIPSPSQVKTIKYYGFVYPTSIAKIICFLISAGARVRVFRFIQRRLQKGNTDTANLKVEIFERELNIMKECDCWSQRRLTIGISVFIRSTIQVGGNSNRGGIGNIRSVHRAF
jgi:hypothetical protein